MDEVAQPRQRYDWEQLLIAALVADEKQIRADKVATAQRAIRKRISELVDARRNSSQQSDLFDEILALHEALRTLAAIQRL